MDEATNQDIYENHMRAQAWLEQLVASKTDQQLDPAEKQGLLVLGRLIAEFAAEGRRFRTLGTALQEDPIELDKVLALAGEK